MSQPIAVTSPTLPPLDEFLPYLQQIWSSRRLTNGGPFHVELESALVEFLGVEHISLFTNGTLALVTALQALRIRGEVITTPYSFVATSHALHWNGLKPVFVDIDRTSCNLDPTMIERSITAETTAILPVHCYGIPCDVDAIQRIADIYGLRVIYDAAHAFGVKQYGQSILNYGDLSILSFHATKVFNTFEGGAIVCPDRKTKERIDFLKNFGFADETTVVAPGINGKMNEFQAALGLAQLPHLGTALQARQRVFERYSHAFSDLPGISVLRIPEGVDWNYSYCPIFIDADVFGASRDGLYQAFRDIGVLARRYFYPLINDFPMYRTDPPLPLPRARVVSDGVLCLPVYPHLGEAEQDSIIECLVSMRDAGR